MSKCIISNTKIVNQGKITTGSVYINGELIEKITDETAAKQHGYSIINGKGKLLIPGVIDDQVHFREPGLTAKANIYTEAKAAIAGGITSFMEMPNTIPPATTIEKLEEKYAIAQENSLANYSFYLGATNDNMDELAKVTPANICGVKVFMGSSTGNMLVDNKKTLEQIFKQSPVLIATHCEDEQTIRKNIADARSRFGDDIPIGYHPVIRSAEACYKSSSFAVELATKYNARLHILHISTGKETSLFVPGAIDAKKITAEVCVHHLFFNEKDYAQKGSLIKWNPAIKTEHDQHMLWEALLNNQLDVIATDHAPHTLNEKLDVYTKAPSGGPLVQHALVAMLDFVKQQKISIETVVEKMCHNPARLFQIKQRGFIKEGYYADMVLLDPEKPWSVSPDNILYKCGWSPFNGHRFGWSVTHTIVNGHLAYENGIFNETVKGKRLTFKR